MGLPTPPCIPPRFHTETEEEVVLWVSLNGQKKGKIKLSSPLNRKADWGWVKARDECGL